MSPYRRRLVLGGASLVLAAAIWLPCLHLFYTPSPAALAARPAQLAERQIALFQDRLQKGREADRMRRTNPEWDLMGRTFFAYALAERALADPAARPRLLGVLDAIVEDTLRLEREGGIYHFLMPYAKRQPFVMQPARSQFLDGEIALMLALRRLVAERKDYQPLLAARVDAMVARMRKSPSLSAESYPDECWTFCNAVALAAMRAADVLDGTDHRALARDWIEKAKTLLVDPGTGMLVSSYTLDGHTRDGPEGSSVWMAAHMLRAVDLDFAEDQYRRAKKELGQNVLGFGYAREWPRSRAGHADVDSGPIVPWLDVSSGSSGLAFVAASSFGDHRYLEALSATLDLAAFPIAKDGSLRYAASNQVGDAIILYALSIGPLWDALVHGRRP